mmetsp:Transcript_101732/g.265615  ORF Transcript_101732/g.265615 Transcript_101732/m.265615 type:complete len:156 (-) Transcript_101732:24-491(-)
MDCEAATRTADASFMLVRLALPSAQMARQHCLAKQARQGSLSTSEGEGRPSLPALLGSRGTKQTVPSETTPSAEHPAGCTTELGERRLRFADATVERGAEAKLPVVLGRLRPVIAPAVSATKMPEDARSAAELACQSHRRRMSQMSERSGGLAFP